MADIIIIDDERDVRATVRKILERDGHTVRDADNGNQGIRLHRERPADLVITDLFMPDKEGIETIRELRELSPELRILAVSGGASMQPDGPLSDAEFLGADGSLAKPFTVEGLQDKVRSVLAS